MSKKFENNNVLDKHLEILKKEYLTDEDIRFLVRNIPKAISLKKEDIKK